MYETYTIGTVTPAMHYITGAMTISGIAEALERRGFSSPRSISGAISLGCGDCVSAETLCDIATDLEAFGIEGLNTFQSILDHVRDVYEEIGDECEEAWKADARLMGFDD